MSCSSDLHTFREDNIKTTWQNTKHVQVYIYKDTCVVYTMQSLRWRYNEHDGVSNHRRLDCLLWHLFGHSSKKTSKLRITGLCERNPPVTGGLPSQRAIDAENVSNWWRHHDVHGFVVLCFAVVVMLLVTVGFCDRVTRILQGCFTGTDRCRRSWAVLTHVKYECDYDIAVKYDCDYNVTVTFAESQMTTLEEITKLL